MLQRLLRADHVRDLAIKGFALALAWWAVWGAVGAVLISQTTSSAFDNLLVTMFSIFAALCLATAIGLWAKRNWGRRLAICLSILVLTGIVIGWAISPQHAPPLFMMSAALLPLLLIWFFSRPDVSALCTSQTFGPSNNPH
jgi:hypothetical protein